MTNEASAPVDVLAVMLEAAQLIADLAPFEADEPLPSGLREGRAALAELVSAAKAISLAANYGLDTSKANNRLRAALARVGGAK